MRFEIATPTRIIFGPGVLTEAGPLAKGFGQRAFLVVGRNPGRAARLETILADHGVSVVRMSVAQEPDLAIVEAGTNLARGDGGCDLVIAFGGGSVLDAGKAVAAMLTNDGELLDYLEVIGRGRTLTKACAPFIAIPTTAGTGSEVTRNAVLGSPEHRVKVSLRSHLMLPRVALVDPELTFELPRNLTASTGLDALTQLIEPFVCARPNPITDALCADGIPRVARSLRAACEPGLHPVPREDMALASLFGGLALANAGLGAVHGFAGPIGGRFSAPHGAICAALLPHVMKTNLLALRQRESANPALDRYRQVAAWLTGAPGATTDEGVEWVQRLIKELEIQPLRGYGITSSDAPDLVEQASRASSMKANPIKLTPDELSGILAAAT